MKRWSCDNCGLEFEAPQRNNRCICGFHLHLLLLCDKPSCGLPILGRHVLGVDGRLLHEAHLPELLWDSLAFEEEVLAQ